MEQRHRLGRPLHHGDTIGIVAPSAPVDPERYEKASLFTAIRVYCRTRCIGDGAKGILAGPAELRADDINSFLPMMPLMPFYVPVAGMVQPSFSICSILI